MTPHDKRSRLGLRDGPDASDTGAVSPRPGDPQKPIGVDLVLKPPQGAIQGLHETVGVVRVHSPRVEYRLRRRDCLDHVRGGDTFSVQKGRQRHARVTRAASVRASARRLMSTTVDCVPELPGSGPTHPEAAMEKTTTERAAITRFLSTVPARPLRQDRLTFARGGIFVHAIRGPGKAIGPVPAADGGGLVDSFGPSEDVDQRQHQ